MDGMGNEELRMRTMFRRSMPLLMNAVLRVAMTIALIVIVRRSFFRHA